MWSNKEKQQQIAWLQAEFDQERIHRPTRICQHCQTHLSWSGTCRQCLSEAWHRLRGLWKDVEPSKPDDPL